MERVACGIRAHVGRCREFLQANSFSFLSLNKLAKIAPSG